MKRKILCPICGKWLFTAEEGTQGNIYIWCRQCKEEIKIELK
jgi:phage FluMu protein Com